MKSPAAYIPSANIVINAIPAANKSGPAAAKPLTMAITISGIAATIYGIACAAAEANPANN